MIKSNYEGVTIFPVVGINGVQWHSGIMHLLHYNRFLYIRHHLYSIFLFKLVLVSVKASRSAVRRLVAGVT